MNDDALVLALLNKGGGGGSDLPDVTAADNGKILKVVSGDWAAEDNDVVVNITKVNDYWYVNVSAQQVETALAAGKNVYATVAGVLVTNDDSIKNATLILPLTGIHNDFYAFGGAYRSASQTIEVTFMLSNSLLYRNNMYSRTYNAMEEKSGSTGAVLVRTGTGAGDYNWGNVSTPVVVNYTVTGQPSGGVYPLYTDTSLQDIFNAIIDNHDVYAQLTIGTNIVVLRMTSFDSATGSYVAFSTCTYYNNAPTFFQIVTEEVSSQDVSTGQVIPLSTAQMSFDSSTNTLAITQ